MCKGLRRGYAWRKFLEVGADDRIAAYWVKSFLGIYGLLADCRGLSKVIKINGSGSADHAAS